MLGVDHHVAGNQITVQQVGSNDLVEVAGVLSCQVRKRAQITAVEPEFVATVRDSQEAGPHGLTPAVVVGSDDPTEGGRTDGVDPRQDLTE